MKYLGFVLFVAGLTIASWFASKVVSPSKEEASVEGTAEVAGQEQVNPVDVVIAWAKDAGFPFAGGILLMVLGGVLTRREERKVGKANLPGDSSTDHPDRKTQKPTAMEILAEIETDLDSLHADQLPQQAAELSASLDELLSERIPDFLEQRAFLVDHFGLEVFAEMIGHFAVMERATARAWSALTDEAWEEVEPSLKRAKSGIALARKIAQDFSTS